VGLISGAGRACISGVKLAISTSSPLFVGLHGAFMPRASIVDGLLLPVLDICGEGLTVAGLDSTKPAPRLRDEGTLSIAKGLALPTLTTVIDRGPEEFGLVTSLLAPLEGIPLIGDSVYILLVGLPGFLPSSPDVGLLLVCWFTVT